MARPARTVQKSRLTLDMPTTQREALEALQKKIGADSMVEVVRRSLKLLRHIVEEQEKGAKFFVERAGERNELVWMIQ